MVNRCLTARRAPAACPPPASNSNCWHKTRSDSSAAFISLRPSQQLVAGSVVMAFEEVCPDRIDLIHKNYRKLCNLLMDVEEWGQVVILSMLTRYARTQFVSPWKEVRLTRDNRWPRGSAVNSRRVCRGCVSGRRRGRERREDLLRVGL